MVAAGDQAGGCPRCEFSMICIGWGNCVIGTHCQACDLTIAISGDVATATALEDLEDTDI